MLTLSKSLGWFDAWQYYRRELRSPIVNLVPIGSSWHGQLARHWGLDKAVPTEDTFANVAAGCDPRAGRVLVDDRMSFACIKNESQIPRAIAHRAEIRRVRERRERPENVLNRALARRDNENGPFNRHSSN